MYSFGGLLVVAITVIVIVLVSQGLFDFIREMFAMMLPYLGGAGIAIGVAIGFRIGVRHANARGRQ